MIATLCSCDKVDIQNTSTAKALLKSGASNGEPKVSAIIRLTTICAVEQGTVAATLNVVTYSLFSGSWLTREAIWCKSNYMFIWLYERPEQLVLWIGVTLPWTITSNLQPSPSLESFWIKYFFHNAQTQPLVKTRPEVLKPTKLASNSPKFSFTSSIWKTTWGSFFRGAPGERSN